MSGEKQEAVVISRDGAVGIMRLNRPESLNAFSFAIKDGLARGVFEFLEDPAVRAILITGTGRGFCAGGDLRTMDGLTTVGTRARVRAVHDWLKPLLEGDKPIVTAVNGLAVGAGLSLALVGDIVCASQKATFRAGFLGIGASPDLGLAYTLPRAIGMARAKDLVLTNRDVNVEEALSIGLIARVFEDAALFEKSLEVARTLAEGPPVAIGLAKGLLRHGLEMSLEAFLDAEAFAQSVAFTSEDFCEGLAAFREKRRPRFPGK
ncbi:MAG: enoyl-CoA hydratase/isomerase family protein [Beijerinckiaceae bacterium]